MKNTKQTTLKILHTSDWHLGQKFMGKSREDEHRAFLGWLIDTINQHKVDVLIVAGDIFDTGTPPNYALELYYTFLTKLQSTPCKNTIIIAGNHDSISTLKAPKDILRLLDIHIIASGYEDESVLKIYKDNSLAGIICAVPFLRDSVIRKSIFGESMQDKEKALKDGIKAHYQKVHDIANNIRASKPIPIIATGHFTTVGTKSSDSERDIYIGNTINISSDFLACMFDYVALGHLHHAQKVGYEHIRYSGSPIPLSFSEANTQKSVQLVSFDGLDVEIQQIDIPTYKKLYQLKGDREQIIAQLKDIEDKNSWIELEIEDDNAYVALQEIQEYIVQTNLNVLAKKIAKPTTDTAISDIEITNLNVMTPFDIFEKRLELEEISDKELIKQLKIEFQKIEEKVATL